MTTEFDVLAKRLRGRAEFFDNLYGATDQQKTAALCNQAATAIEELARRLRQAEADLQQALKDGATQAETSLHHEQRAEKAEADLRTVTAERDVGDRALLAHLEAWKSGLAFSAFVLPADHPIVKAVAAARSRQGTK